MTLKNSISFLLFILSFFPYIMFSQTWNKIGDDIIGENSADQSGISISLSGDGQKVAIGAWLNSGGALEKGHVRVYQYQYKNKALTLIKSLPECSSKQDLISLLNFVVEREK